MRRPAANLSVLLSILFASCAARHVAAPQPPGMPIDEGRRTEAYFKRARSKESESARAEDKRYDQLCSKFQQAIYALMIDEKYGDYDGSEFGPSAPKQLIVTSDPFLNGGTSAGPT